MQKAQIEAKNPELENKDQVAHAVGVGAIKFYDLKTEAVQMATTSTKLWYLKELVLMSNTLHARISNLA